MTHSDNDAWQLICAAALTTRRNSRLESESRYALDGKTLKPVAANDRDAVLAWNHGWHSLLAASDQRQACLDLYLPLIGMQYRGTHGSAPLVIGQLGQSIDGYIATLSGQSHYVTGAASILHLHRVRALSDCVIVGAGTVAADDPRLTTRLVSGNNPVRVVLDPQLRLSVTHQVFSDGQAPTLRVRAQGVPLPATHCCDSVEDIELPAAAGQLDLPALLAELQSRGHRSVLVEGGGATVSAFFAADLLDRMHIAVAPFIMGEGRPGLRMPGPAQLQDCRRPPPRIYALGSDVLFDCDLRTESTVGQESMLIRRLSPAMP